ncbi:MAG: HlyD family efflux transporter periplasmic adaptor subunit [Granulosicoccus sp.]
MAELGSSVTGVLESVDVERSQFVKRGDVVAKFESKAERKALELLKEKARSTLDVNLRKASVPAMSSYPDQSERPIAHGMLSKQKYAARESETSVFKTRLVQAEEIERVRALELEHAQALLDRRTVRSPMDGIVVQQHREAGEYVDGHGIVTVAQLHPLHIETFVDSEYIGGVAEGMAAEIRIDKGTDEILSATVDRIDKLVDTTSGKVGIRLVMANEDYGVLAGSNCQVRFIEGSGAPTAEQPGKFQAAIVDNREPAREISGGNSAFTENDIDDGLPTWFSKDEVEMDAVASELAAASINHKIPELCVWPRKFDNLPDAQKEALVLEQDGIESTLEHRTELALRGHSVQSPAFVSRPEAETYMRHLKSAGLEDVALLTDSDTTVRVALGTFENNEGALARLEYVLRQGVRAELLPWVEELDEIYVTPVEWSFLRSANCP